MPKFKVTVVTVSHETHVWYIDAEFRAGAGELAKKRIADEGLTGATIVSMNPIQNTDPCCVC